MISRFVEKKCLCNMHRDKFSKTCLCTCSENCYADVWISMLGPCPGPWNPCCVIHHLFILCWLHVMHQDGLSHTSCIIAFKILVTWTICYYGSRCADSSMATLEFDDFAKLGRFWYLPGIQNKTISVLLSRIQKRASFFSSQIKNSLDHFGGLNNK